MDSFLIITSLLKIVGILFVVILPMVSYAVYAERRVSAAIQDRLGPNRVGPAGLFQPIADMLKLLLKEDFTPRTANTFYYRLAPCLAVMPAIITIAVVPFGSTLLGVEFQISISRRHSFELANDLLRAFARACSHSGFPARR